MKIGQEVTVTDGIYDAFGTIDGFEATDGGYVLHVFIPAEWVGHGSNAGKHPK